MVNEGLQHAGHPAKLKGFDAMLMACKSLRNIYTGLGYLEAHNLIIFQFYHLERETDLLVISILPLSPWLSSKTLELYKSHSDSYFSLPCCNLYIYIYIYIYIYVCMCVCVYIYLVLYHMYFKRPWPIVELRWGINKQTSKRINSLTIDSSERVYPGIFLF